DKHAKTNRRPFTWLTSDIYDYRILAEQLQSTKHISNPHMTFHLVLRMNGLPNLAQHLIWNTDAIISHRDDEFIMASFRRDAYPAFLLHRLQTMLTSILNQRLHAHPRNSIRHAHQIDDRAIF